MRNAFFLAALMLAAVTTPAQDWAKSQLEKSPRHQEWIKVRQGTRDVQSFIVYPQVKEKAPAVVVVHEIFGLTDWVRSVADQLAAAGYIAIAPDLVSGMAPGGGGTSELPGQDAAIKAVSTLPPDQVTADLDAVVDYVSKLPACNGKVVIAGFCWGGSQTFRYATHNQKIKAAFVFYGSGPENASDIARIACPVYGFYGGNDARVDATVPKTAELMRSAGKTYEPVTYEGAGHGFMRSGEAPDGGRADKNAREEGWKRWMSLMKKT